MLFRKRERFERVDVHETGPYANAAAIVVLVMVFALLGVLVFNLWGKASETSHLGDKTLRASLASQKIADPSEGYAKSKHAITNVLVLTVDNVKAEKPRLEAVQILSLDATARTGVLVDLPLDAKIAVDGSPTTFAEAYASKGAAACVAPLSTATNVKFKHVIVATDALFDQIKAFKGAGVASLIGSSDDLLKTIGTNMGAHALMDVAELVQSIGVDNMPHKQAACATEDDGAGGTRSVVDRVQLGLMLGTIVATD